MVSTTALVPTFNRANFLPECLEGLFGQSLPPNEIIVIDDGSTDNTADVASRYSGRIIYLRQSNGGKSRALNYGLAHATGDAIWIFDDDDVPEPDALETLAGALEASPDAGFAFGNYDRFTDESGKRLFDQPSPPDFAPDDLFAATIYRTYIHQPAALVRTSCYREVGGFDESLPRSIDLEMFLRLAARYRSAYVPKIVFHQRQHSGARGPAGQQIAATRMYANWRETGKIVMRAAHARFGLGCYLPEPRRSTLVPVDEVAALINRAVLMWRRCLPDLALADLRSAAERAQKLSRRELCEIDWSYSYRMFRMEDSFLEMPSRAGISEALSPDPRLGKAFRKALMRPLPDLAADAAKLRQRTKLRRIADAYLRIWHPITLL